MFVDQNDTIVTIGEQCEMYDVNRSILYYTLVPANELTTRLMNYIDEEFTNHPYYGRRRITAALNAKLEPESIRVNVKRVDRLMTMMGLEAVYPKKRLSEPRKDAEMHPYLLKGLTTDHTNQVWASDITHIKMYKGYLFLTAVIDWYSRYVLSWELSNTLDTDFCLKALQEALERHGSPEIYNTDQGSQYTSREFISALKRANVKISQDGKGRCLDNRIIERLWSFREVRGGVPEKLRHR
jgi:putative transposase